jgi:hypothetical protein
METEDWTPRLKEVVGVFVLPSNKEMECIRKKVEVGLELDDWEIWVYKEFM